MPLKFFGLPNLQHRPVAGAQRIGPRQQGTFERRPAEAEGSLVNLGARQGQRFLSEMSIFGSATYIVHIYIYTHIMQISSMDMKEIYIYMITKGPVYI